jgi:hypothetical protein
MLAALAVAAVATETTPIPLIRAAVTKPAAASLPIGLMILDLSRSFRA